MLQGATLHHVAVPLSIAVAVASAPGGTPPHSGAPSKAARAEDWRLYMEKGFQNVPNPINVFKNLSIEPSRAPPAKKLL